MESNRDEACRCIELTRLHIKKNNLDIALKFSIKAHKLFSTSETKLLMKKLKSSMKKSKQSSEKTNQYASADSSSSYNSNMSNSLSDDNKTEPLKNNSKQKYKSSTVYSHMFKDINKEESYKCLEIAEQYIEKKQYELADKFITRSKKLFFLLEADELLKKLQEIKEINKLTYTKEQEILVKRVKNSENYYTMLDVKVTATVSEIKKAYKKLALLLHPDKNSAPGSGEVFIVVLNAVDILCDQTKRQIYDQTLNKPTTSTSSHYYPQSSSRQQSNVFHTTSRANRNPYRSYDYSDYPSEYDEDIEFYHYYMDDYSSYDSFDY